MKHNSGSDAAHDKETLVRDITLRVEPRLAASRDKLLEVVAKEAGIPVRSVNDICVVRRSVDARKRPVMLSLTVRFASGDDRMIVPVFRPVEYKKVSADAPRLIVVGAGPAGLFASLEAIRFGMRPIVIERGRDVDARRLDLAAISREKKINPQSNYCFGEGGAGAYSDGKLYTRSRKRGSVEEVLQTFVQHGAPADILVDAHPHIGSDRLPHVIREMRRTILECGGKVLFETCVDALMTDGARVTGVKCGDNAISGDAVILATGHSAHDTFRMLADAGVVMEAKGIAIGVRLEHPQELVDRIQYHSQSGRGKYLPAAEYSFVTQADGRGVYSFCMCPGGVIVPAGSSGGELVVNGMSASARAGRWANSGMVVEIHPGDFPEFSCHGSLEMLELQESLEWRMYKAAGGSIVAPAQRMLDFVEGRVSDTLPPTSYAPGIMPCDLNGILPPFISRRLRAGFRDFGRRARGFLTNDAVLIGLESRTSSPVRMLRDSLSLQSVGMTGLFPAGEGAGYAGGIVSAAIDGIRCARSAAGLTGSDNLNKVIEI